MFDDADKPFWNVHSNSFGADLAKLAILAASLRIE
jgi:hypothetical protein